MRIAVLCPHFEPDLAPTGMVMTSIVHELVERGHQLHVVTVAALVRAPPRRARVAGSGVGRWSATRTSRGAASAASTRSRPTRRTSRPGPSPSARFTALNGATALLSRSRPDVVLAMSPPLTLGPAGWAVAQAHRAPFVFNIQDVFPDVAIEVGRDHRPAGRSPRRRGSSGPPTAPPTRSPSSPTTCATTWPAKLPDAARPRQGAGDPELRRHRAGSGRARRRTPTGPSTASTGKTVVMYAGNLGFSQSVELLLDAAVALRSTTRRSCSWSTAAARPGRASSAGRPASTTCASSTCSPGTGCAEVLAAADVHVVPAAQGPGPLERPVEAVLDPRRRPAGRGQRRPGHRGGDRTVDPGRRRPRGAPRRRRGASPRRSSGLIEDPDAGRAVGPGRPGLRGGLGVAGRGGGRPTRPCSTSCGPEPARGWRRCPEQAEPGDSRWPTHGKGIIGQEGRTGGPGRRPPRPASAQLGFPVAVAPSSILGLLLVAFARQSNQARPRTRRTRPSGADHWHAAVRHLHLRPLHHRRRRQGPATTRSASTPTRTALIHIHPFSNAAAGKQANLGKFFDQVGLRSPTVRSSSRAPSRSTAACTRRARRPAAASRPRSRSSTGRTRSQAAEGGQAAKTFTEDFTRSASARTSARSRSRSCPRASARCPGARHRGRQIDRRTRGGRPRARRPTAPHRGPDHPAGHHAAPATARPAPRPPPPPGPMRAVVLVGGLGTRLRPLTSATPKQMLPIVDRPMIEHVLDHLGRHGVTEAVLSLGLPARRVRVGLPGRRVRRRAAALRGRARAARHRRRHPLRGATTPASTSASSWSTATCSPTSTSRALVAFHDAHGAEATIALHRGRGPVGLRGRADRRRRPGGGLRREAGRPAPRRPTSSTPAPTCSSRR